MHERHPGTPEREESMIFLWIMTLWVSVIAVLYVYCTLMGRLCDIHVYLIGKGVTFPDQQTMKSEIKRLQQVERDLDRYKELTQDEIQVLRDTVDRLEDNRKLFINEIKGVLGDSRWLNSGK